MLLIAIAVLAVTALLAGQAIGATADARGTARASGAGGVSIKGLAFHPPTLKVKRGARVTFANNDNTTHTASSGSFDTKRIAPGSSVTVKFSQKGTFAYHCKIHSFMKGKIVVE
ncbi:MAG: cupredoxin domain-containing protein [Solirubrobacterales bacterium]